MIRTIEYNAMNTTDHVNKAIEIVGGQVPLALACRVSQPTVHRWAKGTKVKGEYCPLIEQATNGVVRREDLRPDVFGYAEAPAEKGGER